MARKDSCPSCFTKKFRRRRKWIPAHPDDPEKKNVQTQVIVYICRRCGWEGKLGDLVSTKKISVTKMGKIRSRVRKMRY